MLIISFLDSWLGNSNTTTLSTQYTLLYMYSTSITIMISLWDPLIDIENNDLLWLMRSHFFFGLIFVFLLLYYIYSNIPWIPIPYKKWTKWQYKFFFIKNRRLTLTKRVAEMKVKVIHIHVHNMWNRIKNIKSYPERAPSLIILTEADIMMVYHKIIFWINEMNTWQEMQLS